MAISDLTGVPVVTGRPVRALLEWSRGLLDPALREAVDSMPGSMRLIAGYHFGWLDERGKPAKESGGKAIRPALTLLSAQAAGGDPAGAVPAAVAVELAHNFSLLHDDVMDGDTTRRHRPTVWSVFGTPAAILAGDALLTLAGDVLASSGSAAAAESARLLSAAVLELVEGQSADLSFERRRDVGLAECVRMAERKTGALLGCACALGAAAAGSAAAGAGHLRSFGDRLGLAFQFVDDLLGIWGDPAATGKSVYSDLRSRKKSLPVVAALTSDTGAGREFERLYHQPDPLTMDDLVRAARLVDAAGGRTWCRDQASSLLAEALAELRACDPAPRAEVELTAVAHLMVQRNG